MAKTALQWEESFGSAVPCSAVRSIEAMFDDPQVLAQGYIREFQHPRLGRYRALERPFKFGRTEGTSKSIPAPILGQHTEQILKQLGYDEQEIKAAKQNGAIIGASNPETRSTP